VRVLFVVSLYSAFEKSVVDRVWRPTGAPAISKLIAALEERCQRSQSLQFILLGKRPKKLPHFSRVLKIELQGLRTTTRYIFPLRRLWWPLARLRWYVNEVRQGWIVLSIYRSLRPKIIYVDRANVVMATGTTQCANLEISNGRN